MRPRKNNASDVIPNAPAMRTNKSLAIGLLSSGQAISTRSIRRAKSPQADHYTGLSTRADENGFRKPAWSLSRDRAELAFIGAGASTTSATSVTLRS
jgi:hypothetical protein